MNGFYSEEIQNEDIARFEAEMLPSPARVLFDSGIRIKMCDIFNI